MTAYIGGRHGLGTTGNVLACSHACGLLLICHRLWNQAFVHVGVASAVSTIFVLWAEAPAQIDGNSLVLGRNTRPDRWQLTRPQGYKTLHEAWLTIYRDEYNNGYGKQVDATVDDV